MGVTRGDPRHGAPPASPSFPWVQLWGFFSPGGGAGRGLGAPHRFKMGILAPTGARCHLRSVNTWGKFRRELGSGGSPHNTPPPPPSWVHPWVLPTFPKCSSCDTLLQDRCRAPDTRSPISVGTGGRAAGGGTGRLRRCRRRPVLGPAPAALPAGVRGAEEPPPSPALGLGAELTFFGVVVTPSTATYRPSSTRVKPRPTERELHRVDAVLGMRLALSGKTSPQI